MVRAVLTRNVALNKFHHVRIFDCALGDKPGVLPLRVPKADSAEYSNMGLASLVALDTPHDLVEVPVHTLDTVFRESGMNRLDVVKIDVQGYECQVLAGMREVLDRHGPAVVFEYEKWAWDKANTRLTDALALFEAVNYRVYRFSQAAQLAIEPMRDMQTLPDHIELAAFRDNDPRLGTLVIVSDGHRP